MASGGIETAAAPWEIILGSGAIKGTFGTFKIATGGTKQWLRLGSSYSVSGEFATFSLRWGASPRYAKKIGSPFLSKANQYIRGLKIKFNNWRTNDPGHLHLWKKN